MRKMGAQSASANGVLYQKYLQNETQAHERIIEVHTVLPLIYQAIWKLLILDLICYIHH